MSATKSFWDATRERQLVIQWCLSCDEPVWFPREVCPRCLGTGFAGLTAFDPAAFPYSCSAPAWTRA